MEIGIKIKYLDLTGTIIEILHISPYRPKELYRIKYDNNKKGVLEAKDFKVL